VSVVCRQVEVSATS